jgi:transglutaminase/protease-like cytokinesis protein 3
MDPKLLEILKKAKQVDERAKKYDSTDTTVLETRVNSRVSSKPSVSENTGEYAPTPTVSNKPMVDVNSQTYKERVKTSKLPPEIQKLMLENPIQQVDSTNAFSISEEIIKEINPSYGQNIYNEEVIEQDSHVEMVKGPTQQGFDAQVIKKMIAEEIAKALPSIVEKYFDKKMIQENVKALNAIRRVKKPNNKD